MTSPQMRPARPRDPRPVPTVARATASLFPHHAFTRQAEESARQRLREAFGPGREHAAMQRVVDLHIATLMPLDAIVSAVIDFTQEDR